VYEKFPGTELEAKSAYVYDVRTGEVIFAKNQDLRMPLASITKLMSALVAVELSPAYAAVTVSAEALATLGDSGLKRDEKWTLKDLIDFSLITSSNDGMRAIALSLGALDKSNLSDKEVVSDFVREMNKKAGELGLANTYFWNETGLDVSEYKGGAYGSAKDISHLMQYILINHPEVLEATKESSATITSLDNFKYEARNTNSVANDIPGLRGSKTGFTDIAGGNLSFIFDPEIGRPIVITILGSSAEGRFEDAKKLIQGTLEYINQ